MNKYKKTIIIFLVAGFGILTGLELKELIALDFEFNGNYILVGKIIMYFSLMSVMLYEWIKLLNQEKIK